jgi:hypothetical protein
MGNFMLSRNWRQLILNMLHEILSQVEIDWLIVEHGHKVYIYRHVIAILTPLNLFGPELGDVQ